MGTLCFEQKNKKNIKIFLLKIFNLYSFRKSYILHGHDFVMNNLFPPLMAYFDTCINIKKMGNSVKTLLNH